MGLQDFQQLLQPGLQILRPPRKNERDFVPGNFVSYNESAFVQETGLQPRQASAAVAAYHDSIC